MRAWHLLGAFGLNNLKLGELKSAPLLEDEVRVRIRACSLNYRDLLVIDGIYNPRQKLPLIPVSDGAGEVVEVGAKVSSFKPGDRVMASFSQAWDYGEVSDDAQKFTLGSPLPGMLAEERVFKERGLVLLPPHLSFIEGATLPCAGVTAFNAIVNIAKLKPGDTVLIEGSGGVAIFALQFAGVLGLKTIVLSSTAEKIARLTALGASHVIDYKLNEDWPHEVMAYTNGQGVDAVLDVGGGKTLAKAIKSARRGGAICLIGMLGGSAATIEVVPILMKQLKLLGVFVGSKNTFLAMNRVIEHSKLRPVIDRVFTFEEGPEAFKYLADAQHFGKVCIEVGGGHQTRTL